MSRNTLRKNKKSIRPSASKEPGNAPISIVSTQIDVRPFNRPSAEITNWRNAIRSSESLFRKDSLKHNLFAEVVLDGHVEACLGKRIDPVTNANWQFVDRNGKPVDPINQIIDTIGFEKIVKEIVMSKMKGYRIIECRFGQNSEEEWEVYPWICPDLNMRPHLGKIAYDEHTDEGIDIRSGVYAKTIMEIGDEDDLGLLMKAAPYQILKRGGLGDYAMFVQVFGNPLVDATWDGFDQEQRIKLNEAIQALGSGGAIIRPAGTELTLVEQKYNASGELQVNFIGLLDKAMSKALLGTTETVEASQSSGYAQSKTHDDQDKVNNESDIDFTRRYLISRIRPILKAAGFDLSGGRFIIEGEDNELTKKESFEMHKTMKKDLGIPIDDDFFYETYGVPKPDNYDELKAEREMEREAQVEDPEEEEDDPGKKPKKLRWLERFFGLASAETGATQHTCSTALIALAKDQLYDPKRVINRYQEGKEISYDSGLLLHTADQLLLGLRRGLDNPDQWSADRVKLASSDIGFEYNATDPALLTAFEMNIFRFSAAKTLAQVQELNYLFRNTTSFADFEKLARQSMYKYNRTWLETEYNTVLLTGMSSSAYYRLLARADVFPYWEYRTVGDDHVRKEHQALHGLILPYNDPRWRMLFPPNGWNCRCYVVPRMKSELPAGYNLGAAQSRADRYFNTAEFRRAKGSGWGVNRAHVAEVFTANQQYTTKQPGMAAKLLNSLRWSDYQLQSYSQARKVSTRATPDYSGSAGEWLRKQEQDLLRNEIVVRDYVNRPLTVDQKGFVYHTSGKRSDRVPYLEAMSRTLESPDVVWIQGAEGSRDLSQVIYLKYYNNETILVIGSMSKNRLTLKTWFPLTENSRVINKYRRGILIRKGG